MTFMHVYVALLLVAALSAFVVPRPVTQQAQANAQVIFTPISSPVRLLAGRVQQRLVPPIIDSQGPNGTARTYQQIADENQQLRLQIGLLTERLRELERVNADRQALGSLRELCRPMDVVGADPGGRRWLNLRGQGQGLTAGMAVLYPGGLAGRLDRVGWGGTAQVQLVTDRAFRMTVSFGRLNTQGPNVRFEPLGVLRGVLVGDGKQAMVVPNLAQADATSAGLGVGDWVLVADNQFPSDLQGYRVGEVTAIDPSRASPLFVDVQVRPQGNLMMLDQVMVLVR